MKTTDIIHLSSEKTNGIVDSLQGLLADFQIYYTNLRSMHWNIKGPAFFTLHEQFEKMYDDVSEKADQIAERILMLGGNPESRFSRYLQTASVKEIAGISSSEEAIRNILSTLGQLIERERRLLDMASEAGDEVTVSLLTDYLQEQEKSVWMLTAYLG